MDEKIHPHVLLEHRQFVRALALRLVRDECDADDLVQDTWLAALCSGPRQPESLRSWLMTVIKRLALDRVRGGRRRQAREQRAAIREATLTTAQIVEHLAIQRAVVDAVLRLVEPFRTAVLLRYYEDLQPAQIAARVSAPVETVRARLRRGIERLRDDLEREHGASWRSALVPLTTMTSLTTTTATFLLSGAMLMSLKTAATLVVIGGIVTLATMARKPTATPEPSRPAAVLPVIASQPAARPVRAPLEPTVDPMTSREASPHAASAAGFSIVGRLIDAVSRDPVVGAAVRGGYEQVATDHPPSTTSAPDGTFRLDDVNRWNTSDLVVASPEHELHVRSLRDEMYRERGTLDVGEIALARGTDVSGRVLEADGTPASGATILLSREHGWQSFTGGNAAWLGDADADGAFKFRHLRRSIFPEGDLVLTLHSHGLGWRHVIIAPDREPIDDVDITLAATAPLVVHVRDGDRRPIAGAEVQAEPRFAPLFFGKPPRLERTVFHGEPRVREQLLLHFSAITDAKGDARMQLPLEAGSAQYDVSAQAARFCRAWQPSVMLKAGGNAEASLVLVPLELRSVSGRVTTSDHRPLAQVQLGLPRGAARQAVPLWVRAETDADGRYRIADLTPPQSFTLWAKTPGFAMASRQVTVTNDADVVNVDFALDTASPIAGRLVDQEGAPVPGVIMTLHRGEQTIWGDKIWTTEAGSFAFPDATAGDWMLEAGLPRPEEWADSKPAMQVTGGDANVTMIVHRGGTVRARLIAEVVDLVSGELVQPVSAQLVRAVDAQADQSSEHGPTRCSAGSVTVERVPPGRWMLTVAASEGRKGALAVEVAELDRDVQVRAAVARSFVSGSVVLGEGMTFPTLFVQTHPDGHQVDTAGHENPGVTDCFAMIGADGTFRFGNLTPGRVRLTLHTDEMRIGDADVEVRAGEEAVVELRPIAGATLEFLSHQAAGAAFQVEIAEGDGDWKLPDARLVGDDGQVQLSVLARPGLVHWRACMFEPRASGIRGRRVELAHGDLSVVANQHVTLTVE